jgi:hypothetical protein
MLTPMCGYSVPCATGEKSVIGTDPARQLSVGRMAHSPLRGFMISHTVSFSRAAKAPTSGERPET